MSCPDCTPQRGISTAPQRIAESHLAVRFGDACGGMYQVFEGDQRLHFVEELFVTYCGEAVIVEYVLDDTGQIMECPSGCDELVRRQRIARNVRVESMAIR